MNKTILHTKEHKTYTWYVIDAEAQKLGRISSEISKILLGKNSPAYNPSLEIKNAVIIINAEKIEVTGKKKDNKFYYRHSGRPGGLTIETFNELKARIPNRIIEKAVKGMLPKNKLGRSLFNNLKVYSGKIHPHQSQKPQLVTIK
jgi:large subunit ribosomal protein L13